MMSRNQRRQFLLAALAMSTSACFFGFAAAQGKPVRVGILNSSVRPNTGRGYYDVLLEELAKTGWSEGRNMTIDWRYADGDLGRHAALAAELVALKPDLIIAGTQPAAVAAMKATSSIPIVFVQAPTPVEVGLAVSLAHPGKNVTGFASMNTELVVKRVELMRDAFPKCSRIAIMYQPDFELNVRQLELAERAAKQFKLDVVRVQIGLPETFEAAFAEMSRARPGCVLVIENPSVYAHRRDIVERMSRARLAAMYGLQDFALEGGLISYSIRFEEQYRRAADYVARILRGTQPGDLPIQQPLMFELAVNLQAAKALGLKLPQPILARANRVIE